MYQIESDKDPFISKKTSPTDDQLENIKRLAESDQKEKFKDAWRGLHKGTDEHFSTQTVLMLLQKLQKMKPLPSKEKINMYLRLLSRLRLPTNFTGFKYQTPAGIQEFQHPTSSELEMFTKIGKNHNRWDQLRRQLVMKKLKEKGKILSALKTAVSFTLRSGVAPAMASNQQSHFTSPIKKKQTLEREQIKRIRNAMSRKTPKRIMWQTKLQSAEQPWVPSLVVKRPPSPARDVK